MFLNVFKNQYHSRPIPVPHLSKERKLQFKFRFLRLLFSHQLFSPNICAVSAYGQLTLDPMLLKGIWYLELISEITEFKFLILWVRKPTWSGFPRSQGSFMTAPCWPTQCSFHTFSDNTIKLGHCQNYLEKNNVGKTVWAQGQCWLFKTDLIVFWLKLNSSPSSERLCPSPWVILPWVSENASDCLMNGRTNYRL